MSALAVTIASAGNPYQPIVAKNVFRLRSPPDREAGKTAPLPPTITLQGITCFSLRKQALFRVVMATRPGEPPKETALVLNEGGRLGEIEVLEISARTATVKFRNHGQVQVLCLVGSPGGRGAQ